MTTNQRPAVSTNVSVGALTLLCDCVGGRAGERLLIVSEPKGSDFYDEEAPALTAEAARAIGMIVYETKASTFSDNADASSELMQTLSGFDHVVFFSRVGDQIRFSHSNQMPPATMCYTLNRDALDSAFGTACYSGLCEIKKVIDNAFLEASHIRVTCPRGTNYSGRPDWQHSPAVEVSLKRFPMLVPQPVPSSGFSGHIVLSRFLIGTGSRFYEPYYLPLPNDVFASVKNNRITHFEGKSTEVARVKAHYRMVSDKFSIKPWYVHSWHAGMHPGCNFQRNAQSDILRWSGSAFGSPRILHFHTCGDYAPGEISWNILDPTIYLDDIAVWENGNLHPERLKHCTAVLEKHPQLATLYEQPHRSIGLGD